jgi:hypothetical protein
MFSEGLPILCDDLQAMPLVEIQKQLEKAGLLQPSLPLELRDILENEHNSEHKVVERIFTVGLSNRSEPLSR